MSISPQEAMFNEAMSAVQSGDRARARDLLTRLLKVTQDNVDYWLWMSAVVETPKERSFCLEKALQLDPQNAAARRGMILMGMLPPDSSLVLPVQNQRRSWQAKLVGVESSEEVQAKPAARPQLALIGIALVVVLALVAYAFWGRQQPSRARRAPLVIAYPTDTQVLAAATTPTVAEIALDSSTPFSLALKATYTPTPLYINTPHASIEAFGIGLRAFQRGDWPGAETYFKQVATEQPGAPDVLYYLGETYRQQKEDKQALQVFNQVISQSPNFAPAYLGRARVTIATNAKNNDSAVKDLQSAIAKDPNFGEAYLELAQLQMKMKDPSEAFNTLDQAAKVLPDSALVYLYRAQAYLAQGDPQQALENARRANRLDVTLLPVYRVIGQALQAQDDLPGSLQPLNLYVTYVQDDAQAWAWLAKAFEDSKKSKEALEALNQSLRLDSHQQDALLLRAQINLDQGKADDAMDDYKAAQRYDSTSFDSGLGIGKALMALKYPGDAYMQFERARGLAKTERQKAEAVFWRAQSLEKLGELDVALRDYQSLVSLPADSADQTWVDFARQRIAAMLALTPSPRPKTSTPTLTPTSTRQPTRTLTPTATKKP